MMRLKVDFGPVRRPVSFWMGWVVLVLAIALMSFDAWRYLGSAQARKVQISEFTAMQKRFSTPGREADARPQDLTKAGWLRANQLVDRLNAPWGVLFESLELSANENVAVLGMEPDIEHGEVRISVEARDMGAMLGYVRDIDAMPGLHGAYLESHQVVMQDPLHPVRFNVAARWANRSASVAPESDMAKSEKK